MFKNVALCGVFYFDTFVKLQFGSHPVAVVEHTFTHKTIHRTTQKFGRVQAVPHLCGVYPGVCLTTEEKARKNLSQGSRRVPVGTIKIHKHTIIIRRYNNKIHKLLY